MKTWMQASVMSWAIAWALASLAHAQVRQSGASENPSGLKWHSNHRFEHPAPAAAQAPREAELTPIAYEEGVVPEGEEAELPEAKRIAQSATKPRSYTYARYGAGGEAQRAAHERMQARQRPVASPRMMEQPPMQQMPEHHGPRRQGVQQPPMRQGMQQSPQRQPNVSSNRQAMHESMPRELQLGDGSPARLNTSGMQARSINGQPRNMPAYRSRRTNNMEPIPAGEMVGPPGSHSHTMPGRPQPGAMVPSDVHFDDSLTDGIVGNDGTYIEGGFDGGGCDTCGMDSCCCDTSWLWENLTIFGGVESFRNVFDFGTNANFGFHEGVNWAVPLIDCWGVGFQFGFQTTQTNLDGSFDDENDSRNQWFVTTGFFKRQHCDFGWQGGMVVDWLHDEYFESFDLAQLRPELSYVIARDHDIGFWATIGVNQDQDLEALDMYAFFIRRQFCNGAVARFMAGWTGESNALLSIDATAPLTQTLALQVGALYLMPRNDLEEPLVPVEDETWGLAIRLVWTPGWKTPCSSRNPYRAMFNVADNNTMVPAFTF